MARPKVRFCLVFERELLSVPVMRQVLGDTLRGIGVSEDSVADILLAATEACTNVVLHAGQSAPAYTVAATVDKAACRVEVTDAGQGCSKRWRGRPRRSADLAESGRGFAIMRASVDAVTLRSAPGQGTRVVLDKRIHWEAPVAALPALEGSAPRVNSADVRIGVVTFPGSLDDTDAARAVRYAGAEPARLWHADRDLRGVDAVILPGGFSYGDYLRCGAIARFSPVMAELIPAARAGLPVLGICNGFQILCEAHLLPGALTRNAGLRFIHADVRLTVANATTPWTAVFTDGQRLTVPIKNGEGAFVADEATLDALERGGRVVARYTDGAPNGSSRDIAGICNEAGNVVGLMPHPEHAIDPLTGPSADGLGFFTSIVGALAGTGVSQ